ncbi:hypothetical protein [Auraticoccus monumenti]|uniref:hypothetical protein n=1 Tax=Auraticoccus monumenti TaxID=675864 RepID=UPI000B85E111|nr:hypothetical protein [Auraticoccus monumenti]
MSLKQLSGQPDSDSFLAIFDLLSHRVKLGDLLTVVGGAVVALGVPRQALHECKLQVPIGVTTSLTYLAWKISPQ